MVTVFWLVACGNSSSSIPNTMPTAIIATIKTPKIKIHVFTLIRFNTSTLRNGTTRKTQRAMDLFESRRKRLRLF